MNFQTIYAKHLYEIYAEDDKDEDNDEVDDEEEEEDDEVLLMKYIQAMKK